VETIRRTVESSPVFEESGVQEQLLDGLTAAQDELSRIKRENRRALREVNRQVRVGNLATTPNLLLITAERLGYGDLGCYGQTRYATPQLDRLAAEGARFSQFYAGSCDPRGAGWCLITGLNTGRPAPPRTEPDAERFVLNEEQKTLAEVLWQSGYSTCFLGAWGQSGLPIDYGFEEWTGFRSHAEAGPYPTSVHVDAVQARILKNEGGGRGVLASDFLIEEGLSFIARHAAAGRPYFLHLALPVEIAETPVGQGGAVSDAEARIVELDAMVGRIMRWLEESNLTRKTCVLFLATCAPSPIEATAALDADRTAGLRSTDDGLGEGNLRVPLIVSWPGRIAAGMGSDHVCAAWDILPTLADLAGAQRRPPRIDGLSFAPSLLGRSQREHSLLYWETRVPGFGQAVRKGQWKGVRHAGQATLGLFDLATDPRERIDLAARRPEVVEQLIVRRH
jgi:arylsulfatase A-like enzyme